MASDILQPVQFTNIHDKHSYDLILVGATGAAPTLGAGDPNAAYFVTPTRSATGVYSLVMKHKYPSVAGQKAPFVQVNWLAATPAGTQQAQVGVPTWSSTTGVWTFPILTWVSGSAADVPTGDFLSLLIDLSNSLVVP